MTDSGGIRQRLRESLDPETSRLGARLQLFIQLLIVLSVIGFTIETLPDLDPQLASMLRQFEILVIAIFSAEYLLRLYVAENRRKFVFSFFGIIDLLVIVPFYLQLGFDLRSLRVFWLLRLFRVLKLVRYGDAARRLGNAFRLVRYDLAVFAIGASLVLYLASVGIYFFEHEAQPEAFASVFHALWWAVVTLTTVGYGDVYPITLGGRLFTFGVIMVGLGVFAVPTALIVMALVNSREEVVKEKVSDKPGK
jgi:voltage-gated potassium channel